MDALAPVLQWLGWLTNSLVTLLWLWFGITLIRERALRGAGITVAAGLLLSGLLTALLLMDATAGNALLGVLLLLLWGLGLLMLLPFGNREKGRDSGDIARVDERDAVFHRFYRLKAGTPEYEKYYAEHPDLKEQDDRLRSGPGLSEAGTQTWDPHTSPFMDAAFDTLEPLCRNLDWPAPDTDPVTGSPELFARRIEGFARHAGADMVRTTVLNPDWVYSNNARSEGPWGEDVNLTHTHAVAIAVQMDHAMMQQAPHHAVATESSLKYLKAGTVAVLVARYIQSLGYEARAHIDGNYRVMCIPVAIDAGLGELGRLGLLMTPQYGPRVRIAIVSTTMPLPQSPRRDFGVQDFCSICKKCARNCPSQSVDSGEKALHNGTYRWQSGQDSCYRYWRAVGSDCGLCIRVCPYAHPDSAAHHLIRWIITRNPLARRLAFWADTLLYGSGPAKSQKAPLWHASDADK